MVKKVIFADLDGTLIETASGETFPKGIWDMKIRYDVLEAIKRCNVEHLAVVSNQAGIAAGYVIKKNFERMNWHLKTIIIAWLIWRIFNLVKGMDSEEKDIARAQRYRECMSNNAYIPLQDIPLYKKSFEKNIWKSLHYINTK